MKASEICIGDWFKAIDYNSPFRITAIYDDVVQTQADYQSEIDGNWYSEAEIKDLIPIPLTEEILVKNGFERHPLWHHCTLEVGDGSKIYIPLACGGGIEYVSIYKHSEELTTRDIDIQIPIHYVHQLQHLLRLCGIEKEIEL